MNYIAGDNGLSIRCTNDDPQTGEVSFDHWPTPDDLTAAFPGYAAAVAPIAAQPQLFAAQQMLAKSDIVMIRQYEEGCPPPTAWVAYRQQLRAYIDSGATLTLPTPPPYPS